MPGAAPACAARRGNGRRPRAVVPTSATRPQWGGSRTGSENVQLPQPSGRPGLSPPPSPPPVYADLQGPIGSCERVRTGGRQSSGSGTNLRYHIRARRKTGSVRAASRGAGTSLRKGRGGRSGPSPPDGPDSGHAAPPAERWRPAVSRAAASSTPATSSVTARRAARWRGARLPVRKQPTGRRARSYTLRPFRAKALPAAAGMRKLPASPGRIRNSRNGGCSASDIS